MTAAQALKHPTWNMGAKITIDSSTLMNKGLEVIEAHHLFDMPYDRIKVVVQPQSAIHSMVEYSDGSVKAHLGTTDMRIPIQFALSYPDRWDAPVEPLDFTQLGKLEFYPVDEDTFRCFKLAKYAGNTGGTLPCVMNAANEVAVAAFLRNACGYLDIDGCVGAMMEAHEAGQGGGLRRSKVSTSSPRSTLGRVKLPRHGLPRRRNKAGWSRREMAPVFAEMLDGVCLSKAALDNLLGRPSNFRRSLPGRRLPVARQLRLGWLAIAP